MGLFEFILIITSVIYAMALAQILSGVSRLAQTSATIRWYFPHTLWIAILFVWVALVWWSVWEFRLLDWTFPRYLYMLIAPTLVFFTCSLLVPQDLGKREFDLEAHFFRVRRPFLGSFAFATFVAVIDGSVLADEPFWFPTRVGHVALIVSVLVGLYTENKFVQNTVAAIVMIALAYITVTRLWSPR
jgi:hypothetical protein